MKTKETDCSYSSTPESLKWQ